MGPLEAVTLAALLLLPFHCAVMWHLDREDDPEYLRSQGIVVVRESILEGHAGPIGEYSGHAIWAGVRFMGLDYRFDRVARPEDKDRTGPGELYLDPGLVYALRDGGGRRRAA